MIRNQAINGVKWASAASLAGNAIQLLQLIIVSKFISAADYGIMSFTLVIIYFAQMLGEMGISNAIIYKQSLSKIAFSSLFWVSCIFCFILFTILFFSAPSIAVFFGQPLLKPVLRYAILCFVFLPFQIPYLAVLKKGLYFNVIALGEIVSKAVALVVAIVLAVQGRGVFALVFSTLSGLGISTLIYFYYGVKLNPIQFRVSIKVLKEFLHFGVFQTGNDFLNYLNFQIDIIILGKLLQIDALGYYAFAKTLAIKLSQIINPIITQVAFPIIARENHNISVVKKLYLKMISYISTINFLIYPFLAAMAGTIIQVFFASKWLSASSQLQLLAVYCMFKSLSEPNAGLMSALGMVKRLFFWNLVLALIFPLVILIASAYGGIGVALALTIFICLLLLPMCSQLLYPACGISFRELWKQINRPVLISVVLFSLLSCYQYFILILPIIKLVGAGMLWLISGFFLTQTFNKPIYREAIDILPNGIKKFL